MLRLLILALTVLTVLAPTLWRAARISYTVSAVTGQDSPAIIEILRNDAPLLAAIFALLVLAMALRRTAFAVIAFIGALALHLALALDLLVYRQFSHRLAWADIVKFYDYALSYIADFDLAVVAGMAAGVAVYAGLATLIFKVLRGFHPAPKTAAALIGGLAVVSAAGWFTRNLEYVHYRFYQNFLSYNKMISAEAIGYSDAYAAAIKAPPAQVCTAYPVQTGPVIVYMMESLSSYQSKVFGGANDWTPQLDALARDNLALTNFFANGFTTEDGELSLLTARPPLYPPDSFSIGGGSSFAGHWAPDRALPRLFNEAGYTSVFLTTSDLAFSSTGDWMEAIGFEIVEGSEDPFYDGLERFHFDAPADAALVDNILGRVARANAPQFIFAKTVSSHHPHIHPETGERSVEAIMRYTDAQLGRLYDGLVAQGFFETGHLVVVGDHRAMLALTPEEVARVGLDKAYTQVPAVVISNALAPEPAVIDDAYSQVDLANSLMASFGGQACHGPFQGLVWGSAATPPDYVLHRRGDRRHQVSVFSDGALGLVTLGGDNTRFTGAAFPPEDKKTVLDYINGIRINAQQANENRQDP